MPSSSLVVSAGQFSSWTCSNDRSQSVRHQFAGSWTSLPHFNLGHAYWNDYVFRLRENYKKIMKVWAVGVVMAWDVCLGFAGGRLEARN